MTRPKPQKHSNAVLFSLQHLDQEKIAFEFARNHVGPKNPIEVLLMDCNITAQQFAALADDALFQRRVREYAKELTENGTSFTLKARLLAEDLLATNYKLAKHPETPPSVAEKLIANTVRWAGLEKKPDAADSTLQGGPKIAINISLDGATQTVPTISIDTTKVESGTLPDQSILPSADGIQGE